VATDEKRHTGRATGRRVTEGKSVGYQGRYSQAEGRHRSSQDGERTNEGAARPDHVACRQTSE